VAAELREFDVALLRLDADTLAEPPWTSDDRCDAGTIAATVGMSPDPIAVGVIGDPRDHPVPADRGFLSINVKAIGEGLEVTGFKWSQPYDLPYVRPDVQAGDLLLSIDGTELKTVPQYDDFWHRRAPTAGEPISLVIRRQGRTLTTTAQCPPNGYDLFYELDVARELSPRRSDFPTVIVHDGVLRREQCGSPLVDISGKIIGINIARAGRHATYAIPTRIVRVLIERLRPS
jgi:serine protease Do